jgi:hypothetical protein
VTVLTPEERLQVYVVRRLRDILPADAEFRAIEQGVHLRGTEEERARAWVRLMNKGVRPGVCDLHLWWRGVYLTIELKWGRNTVTEAEGKFIAAIRRAGFLADAAWSAAQVETIIRSAGIPLSGTMADIDARLAIEQPVKPRTAPRARSPKPKPDAALIRRVEAVRDRRIF